MTTANIQQLQTSLGIPATGIFDDATSAAMNEAVSRSLSSHPEVQTFGGANNPTAILNAYMTGDWSGVTSLSGKPFTDEQQKAAVQQANTALAPAYEAEKANDAATVEATLQRNQQGLGETERDQAIQFGKDKRALDQNSADQGVLFSGSRLQKQNDLRTSYANAEETNQRIAGESAADTTRAYQYNYGNDAVKPLKSFYSMPGAQTYNPNVAGGSVGRSPTLASVYDPSRFSFQGTKPVAQTAAVQTRAANLLANRANKLSLSGVGAKF